MKPNRLVLFYLVVCCAAASATVILNSAAAILWVAARIMGRPDVPLNGWGATVTILTLGVLPWPGILGLARAIVYPRKADDHHVVDRPVGPAAVVLTALNEEQAIPDVVRDFVSVTGIRTVTVIDNDSRDRTAEIARSMGADVVSETRRGYGYACRRGLAEGLRGGQPIIVLCEADGTFRAQDVEKMLPYLKHADLVIGSRTHGALLNGDSQLNSFLTLGNLFVAKLLQLRYWDWTIGGHVRLTDVGCTYRAIRADALRKILPALRVGSGHFGPHMVMVALEHGLRVVEVPVTFWRRIGRSKGGNARWGTAFALGLAMIWHILTYRVARSPEGSGSPADELTHALSP